MTQLTKEEIEMINAAAIEWVDRKWLGIMSHKNKDFINEVYCFKAGVAWQQSQLKAERERAGKLMGNDDPFPLNDVLRILITATEILLHIKDYDGPDYEEMELAVLRAKETQRDINEYNNQ